MSHNARILIVDDEPNVRLVFRTALESVGLRRSPRPRTATTALERLERTTVDLVLLDLQMPGMGGMEVLRTLARGGQRRPGRDHHGARQRPRRGRRR